MDGNNSASSSAPQSLVAGYARHVLVEDDVHQTLDAHGDRSFGVFGFHAAPGANTITVRVFVVRTLDKEYPERLPQMLKVRSALSNPVIGGKYETDGAAFLQDAAEQRLYLTKQLPVSLSPDEFNRQVDHLRAVGARWFYSWFGHVALQALGKEEPPPEPVTLERDPCGQTVPNKGRDASGVLLPGKS